MFDRIDIRLERPLCKHVPSNTSRTWKWDVTVDAVDGSSIFGLMVWCTECDARIVVPREKFVAAFVVADKPAEEVRATSISSGQVDTQRKPHTTFARGFTPFDRRYCKQMGIRYEGE